MSNPSPEFFSLLTDHQLQLRGYILASVGDHTEADDILQKTNLTLCRKADEFRQGAPFLPWAIAVARFEILSFVRDRRRDRMVLHADVVQLMTEAAAERVDVAGPRQNALRKCLEKMESRQRTLLDLKYVNDASIAEIARQTDRTSNAVKSLLVRIRRLLSDCIERSLKAES